MASNMSVETLNDVKVYNLSAGKTMPEWLDERQRRRIANSDEFRQRVEIIQDFDFPVGSQRIQISRDNNYVVATGTYKPRVKVFEFAEMSLKFERYLDSAVVQFYQVRIVSCCVVSVVIDEKCKMRSVNGLPCSCGVKLVASWGRREHDFLLFVVSLLLVLLHCSSRTIFASLLS